MLLRRRPWLLGLPAALGAATVPRPARAGARRILIVGDSMIAGAFGLFLAQKLEAAGHTVVRKGKSSSGLARPDFFDWQAAIVPLVQETRPEVAIAMFGGNDVQGLWMGDDRWIRWPEPGWWQEYARRVDAFAEALAAGGATIHWIGLPIMRAAKFRGRVERVNTIVRAEMAIRERASFVDTWSALADADGEYADRIEVPSDADGGKKPQRVRVRAGDGIHLTTAGAKLLVAYVLDRLRPDLDGG